MFIEWNACGLRMSGVMDLSYEPWKNQQAPVPSNSQVQLFDLIRGMSEANSKGYEYTDSKGNLQGVLCDIEITANTTIFGTISGVPNSWKVRNGVRKFHFEREAMFRRAGVRKSEMGKYGKTIRPYLDLNHAQDEGKVTGFCYYDPNLVHVSDACPDSNLVTITNAGGEWTRTTLVAADSNVAVDGAGKFDSSDQWTIHLMDGHDSADAPWTSVGMTYAYNQDRMEVVTPGAEETIVGNNPLALLASQSVTGGDVAEIAEEQELETPPYDISDSGDSIRKIGYGDFRIIPFTDTVTGKVLTKSATIKNVFLPAGYCLMDFSRLITPGSPMQDDFIGVRFDVHGILDCKEWVEA